MSIIADLLRPYTIPGLNELTTLPRSTFRGWILNSKFKVSQKIESKKFVLDVYSHDEMLMPYAYDINRMATAAFETVSLINKNATFPKSMGWTIIQLYYAAYFSAHAIMRHFGVSCSQFDDQESQAVTKIAKLYGFDDGKTAFSGYYCCHYSQSNKTIECTQLKNTHQDVWKIFNELLNNLATKVSTSDFLKKDRDDVINYILSIRYGISHRNKMNTGNWLSRIRNDVNYSHSMGAWYPYGGAFKRHDEMYRVIKQWRSMPNNTEISSSDTSDELLFTESCISIIKLAQDLILDLHSVSDKSFLDYGAMRYIKHLDGHV